MNWWTRFVRRKLGLDAAAPTPAPAVPPPPPKVVPVKPLKPTVPKPTVHEKVENRTYSDPTTDMMIMGAILASTYDSSSSSCDTSSSSFSSDSGSSCSFGD